MVKRPVANIAESRNVAERIIQGARAHFMGNGFRKASMDELAAVLGMSKKTVYQHFSSKTELLEAVIENKLQSIEGDLDAVFKNGPADFHGRLTRLLACMQRHAGEIQPAFVRDIRMDAPQLFERVQQRRAKFIQKTFGRLFEQGQKAGQIRSDLPVNLMVEILLAATQAIANPAKVGELNITLAQGISAVTTIVLQGVLKNKKGLR